MSSQIGPPPIKGTPGDLLMVFESGASELRRIRDNDPDNLLLVKTTAQALRIAIDHWIKLAGQRGNGS